MFERFRQAWKIAKQMDEKKAITPMSILPNWKNNQAVYKEWNTDNAIKHGLKASTWIYACVNRITKTASSIPWKVYRQTDEGLEELVNHPLEMLLKKPNPFISGGDLMERMIHHLYLGGNTILSKVRANGVIAELWTLPPDVISPVPSSTNFIAEYEYYANGRKERIAAEDIIHIMFVDPSNSYWGLSPIQAIAKVVDTDNEIVNFQMMSLQNRAITDGVFSFREPLTERQWEDARKMIREQHMGSENARTPWVLGGDATWQQMSLSPAEMDFIESRNFSREEICSVFNVPPPMIGIYENATLSNIETARKIFWLDTIIPLLDDLKSNLNLSLAPEFGEDLVLSYDISKVQALQENYNDKVTTAESLWNMGVPFNEINQKLELGFDGVDGGDVGYLGTNVLPVNLIPLNRMNQNASGDGRGRKKKELQGWESEEQKELFWKDIDGRRMDWIEQMSSRIETLFEEEGEEVEQAFIENGIDAVFERVDAGEEEWSVLMAALYFSVIEDFGDDTFDSLEKGYQHRQMKAFNPWNSIIQSWIRRNTAELVQNVLDTTKDLIRNVVSVAFDEGVGVDVTARRIRNRYQEFSRNRSEVIARTEIVRASNYGSYESARQTGLEPMKEWVSSRDSRVRESHNNMDGVRVGMDEDFNVNGNSMKFPADPDGPASETINCRCVLAYRL